MKFFLGLILLIIGFLVGIVFIIQGFDFWTRINNLSAPTPYKQGYYLGGVIFMLLTLFISILLIYIGKKLIKS